MNLNITAGSNPVDSAVRTYGALQGIRLADEEVAMKKQNMANEQANREAMLKIAQDDSALRQTQGQQAAAKFGWEQTDRNNADTVNKLRVIQSKLAQAAANKIDPYQLLSKEEIDFTLSTPEGKDFVTNLNLVSEKMDHINAFEAAAQKGDGVGAAQAALKIWPQQFNRGDDKFNPGVDIKQTAQKWQDPTSQTPGMVRVGPDGKVLKPGAPGYEQGQQVQLGKRPSTLHLSEDGSAYTAMIHTTTVAPDGTLQQYDSPMTQNRATGGQEEWKPVGPLIHDLMVQKGLADLAHRAGLRTGDKATLELENKKAEFAQGEELRKGTVQGQAQDLEAKGKISSIEADKYVTALLQNNPNIDAAGAMKLAAQMSNDPSWAAFKNDPQLQAAVRAKLEARDKGTLADKEIVAKTENYKASANKENAEADYYRSYKSANALAAQASKFAGTKEAVRLKAAQDDLESARKDLEAADKNYNEVNGISGTTIPVKGKERSVTRQADAMARFEAARKKVEDLSKEILEGGGSDQKQPAKSVAGAFDQIPGAAAPTALGTGPIAGPTKGLTAEEYLKNLKKK